LLRIQGNIAVGQGDDERGEALLQESVTLSRDLESKWLAAVALARLGEVLRGRADYERAEAVQTESLVLIREVGDKAVTTWALRNSAILALCQGNHEQARAFLREGIALCRGVPEQWAGNRYLDALAGLACAEKRYLQAARLLGADEALHETLGLHRTPTDQADHDRFLASARAGCGDAAFDAARAEGRAITPEQVIEDALEPTEVVSPRMKEIEKPLARKRGDLLTARERQIVALIAQGLTNREIGSSLAIAERTVDTHVEHILNKLGFNSRTRIAAWAVEQGLDRSSPD
jgi:non-specific serine/threonine protein kinase